MTRSISARRRKRKPVPQRAPVRTRHRVQRIRVLTIPGKTIPGKTIRSVDLRAALISPAVTIGGDRPDRPVAVFIGKTAIGGISTLGRRNRPCYQDRDGARMNPGE